MAAMAVTPQTTPPAKAPLYNPLPEEVNEGEVGAGTTVREALVVVLTVEVVGVLISSPGKISGVSPTSRAELPIQMPELEVSWRTHCGTRVPAGTGFGNVEGPRILVQFEEYSDHNNDSPPWHSPQALTRLYTTVLHQHGFASRVSSLLGPAYE